MKRILKTTCIIALALTLLSFALIAGCKPNKKTSVQLSEAATSNSTITKETETVVSDTKAEDKSDDKTVEKIEITDGMGNILALDKPAERIIVLVPSVLEIFEGLGAMDKIAEVDNWSVQSGDPLAEGFEGAGDANGINFETITKIDPDLIILVGFSLNEDHKKLTDLGYNVYFNNSTSLSSTYTEIENIAKIVGMEEKGKKLSSSLQAGVAEISDKLKGIDKNERPKVFYMVWNDPIMSAGDNTFINELIETAGGINIVAEDGLSDWPEYSIEKLIKNNPDIMIAPFSLAPDASVILDDSRFSSINAITSKKVYLIPDNPISRPNQNVIKGLKMLSKAFHPDIFGEFEIIE